MEHCFAVTRVLTIFKLFRSLSGSEQIGGRVEFGTHSGEHLEMDRFFAVNGSVLILLGHYLVIFVSCLCDFCVWATCQHKCY